LYHVIARGNDRQEIFHDREDYLKFISLLKTQKEKAHFFLYAFCVMTNHFHLLVERRDESVGKMMLRLLTGYASYYNRKYKRSGHVFQGRHKAILCQSDAYLTKLVPYIHLNPVRAGMVEAVEDYPFSSHRAYLGTESAEIARLVDVDPVLRLFGAKKAVARRRYAEQVSIFAGRGHRREFYLAGENNILGSDEFVDSTIHRIGEIDVHRRPAALPPFDAEALLLAVESVIEMPREEFCGSGKSAKISASKDLLIVSARRLGATTVELADIAQISSSNISRRYDAASARLESNSGLAENVRLVKQLYEANTA
jgi:REP element-mobilizing transposase RayT